MKLYSKLFKTPKDTCISTIFYILNQITTISEVEKYNNEMTFKWKKYFASSRYDSYNFTGKITFQGNNQTLISIFFDRKKLSLIVGSIAIILSIICIALLLPVLIFLNTIKFDINAISFSILFIFGFTITSIFVIKIFYDISEKDLMRIIFEYLSKIDEKSITKNKEIKYPICFICKKTIINEDIVFCPNCKAPFHKVEFLEWLKVNAKCKVCKKEMDLWEFQKFSEKNEHIEEISSIKCQKCKNLVPSDSKFCIFCGFQTKK